MKLHKIITTSDRLLGVVSLVSFSLAFLCPQASAQAFMPPQSFSPVVNNSLRQEASNLLATNEIVASTVEVTTEELESVLAPRRVLTLVATAYTSLEALTDSSPWTTASGSQTRFGVVATNMLPFGTIVKFPHLFGDQEFVVEDRMNARYSQRVDIWLPSYQEAKQFGKRKVVMEVY